MKHHQKLLPLTLVLAALLILISGCAAKGDDSASTASNIDVTEPSISAAPTDYASFSYSDGIDENGFFEGVTALDYVKDFQYQGLSIPNAIHQISQDSIQSEIDNLLSSYTSGEQITDRAVVDGDTVNIDYVGSVDGVEFDGGSTAGMGTDITIGVTSYIDDFLEQLIGHTPGETVNVEVTFPGDYHEESLQSKDAVFITTINYIVETTQPELTDDFVKTNFFDLYGWETVSGMKAEMSEELQKTAIQNYIYEYLTNEVSVDSVPDKLIDYQEKAMLRYYADNADYYGVELDQFLTTYVGVADINELIDANRDSNLQGATYVLASQMVAEDAQLSVGEDDVVDYFGDYSVYEEEYGLPYLKQIVLFQKVMDYISDNSVLE